VNTRLVLHTAIFALVFFGVFSNTFAQSRPTATKDVNKQSIKQCKKEGELRGKGVAASAKESKEAHQRISNRWSKDDIELQSDGTVLVTSYCGVEGTVGTVKYCSILATGDTKKCFVLRKDDKAAGAVSAEIDKIMSGGDAGNVAAGKLIEALSDKQPTFNGIGNVGERFTALSDAFDKAFSDTDTITQNISKNDAQSNVDALKRLGSVLSTAEASGATDSQVDKVLDSYAKNRNFDDLKASVAGITNDQVDQLRDARAQVRDSDASASVERPCSMGGRCSASDTFAQSQQMPETAGSSASRGLTQSTKELADSLPNKECSATIMTCRTNNPGAMRYANWMQAYGGASCGQTNNTACFASMEDGLAAKADLVGRRLQSGRCNTTYELLEVCGYCPSSDGCNPNNYANFLQSKVGIARNEKLDVNNPDQFARLMTGMSMMESGFRRQYTGDQLESAILKYYDAKGIIPVYAEGAGVPSAQSPLAQTSTTRAPYSIPVNTSPFSCAVTNCAQTNQFAQFSPWSGMFNQAQTGISQNGQEAFNQNFPQESLSSIPQAQSAAAVLSASINPTSIKHGGTAGITWSTTNAPAALRCEVRRSTGTLFTGNSSGTYTFVANKGVAGTYRFRILCTGTPNLLVQDIALRVTE
jgi:hypothetical protein